MLRSTCAPGEHTAGAVTPVRHPPIRFTARCASRSALNSLPSAQFGHALELAMLEPDIEIQLRSSAAPVQSWSGEYSSVGLW
jgi:hypothetical protein